MPKDFILDYSKLHHSKALARCCLYAGPQGRAVWVIQSEGPSLEGYHGLSVTNGIEKILATLHLKGYEAFHYIIEHYPGKRMADPTERGSTLNGQETFFRVFCSHWKHRVIHRGTAQNAPVGVWWESMSRADVEALTGGKLDD